MGVFIDYAFHAECPEEELVKRLRRLRGKLAKLPFDSVSRVHRVDPAFQSLPISLLPESGFPLPKAVQDRLEGKMSRRHEDLRDMAAPTSLMLVPKELQLKFFRPALEFSKTTDLWRPEDLPEKVDVPFCLTYYRRAFELELAGVMNRHGYLIVIQPCEGCETFRIGLTSFRNAETPLWLGSGFTKTQYATRFVEAHESICTALDLAGEEGLLLDAGDTCKFYQHRDWAQTPTSSTPRLPSPTSSAAC